MVPRILAALIAITMGGAALDAQAPALQMSTLAVNPALGTEALQSCGLAVDNAGTIYVGTFDATLRKIAADGTVSVLAGAPGQSGTVDGAGGAARLNANMGLAVDAAGTVYICERSGTIRRVTADGTVASIAGSAGAGGYADGTGSSARFNGATRICYDPASGDLFVADTFNNVIRKVTPAGVVTTIAGQPGVSGYVDGDAAAALFAAPTAIACDSSGNLYVADYTNAGSSRVGSVRMITPSGTVSTLAAGLASQIELGVDGSGHIYVAGSDFTVTEVSAAGAETVVAGVQGVAGDADGLGVYATLSRPDAIALRPDGSAVIATADVLRVGAPVLAAPTAPQIVQLPGLSPNATVYGPLTVSVVAAGYPAPTYQWYRNGVADGAPGAQLVFPSFQPSDSGVYTVVATNSAGSATSPALTLTYAAPFSDPRAGAAPVITTQPASQSVAAGGSASFSVGATGAVTYSWAFNGAIVSGASGPTLTLSGVTAAQAGAYAVGAANAAGVVTWSQAATLTVTTAAGASAATGARLINISARAVVGGGAQTLAAGFSISGSGSKTVLMRAVGPSLGGFGVTGFLAQPQLDLVSGGSTLASDGAWGGTAQLSSLMADVGAFALPAASADSALAATLSPGGYSAEVSGADGATGTALAEVFDAQPDASARITNLSARAFVGTGSSALVAGFVVSGDGSETVLVRGIGPALSSFGVAGALSSALVTVCDSTGKALATNSGWSAEPGLAAVFSEVGAFALTPGSADAALVVTLPAGSYTVALTGASGETGIGLIELYEVQ